MRQRLFLTTSERARQLETEAFPHDERARQLETEGFDFDAEAISRLEASRDSRLEASRDGLVINH